MSFFQRAFFHFGYFVVGTLMRLFFRATVHGAENLPKSGPMIVIGNHFSFFEPVFVALMLPRILTAFAAAEIQEYGIGRWLFGTYDIIPVKRGQVDREALRAAKAALDAQRLFMLFPEGGITKESLALSQQGEEVHMPIMESSRIPAELYPPRPGAAYLATLTKAPILPIAIIGAEHGLNNLRRLRRTPVEIFVGEPFGPLEVPAGIRGPARREALAELSHDLMRSLAALIPEEFRGAYKE